MAGPGVDCKYSGSYQEAWIHSATEILPEHWHGSLDLLHIVNISLKECIQHHVGNVIEWICAARSIEFVQHNWFVQYVGMDLFNIPGWIYTAGWGISFYIQFLGNGFVQEAKNWFAKEAENGFVQEAENGFVQEAENGFVQMTENGFVHEAGDGFAFYGLSISPRDLDRKIDSRQFHFERDSDTTVLYCILMHSTIMHCTVQYYNALYCTWLFCI